MRVYAADNSTVPSELVDEPADMVSIVSQHRITALYLVFLGAQHRQFLGAGGLDQFLHEATTLSHPTTIPHTFSL